MQMTWPTGPEWTALSNAIDPDLSRSLERLELELPLLPPLLVGSSDNLFEMRSDGIALDPALLGPGMQHPWDQAWMERHPDLMMLGLDRWRRSTGAILEAMLLWARAQQHGFAPGQLAQTWWTIGWAAERVDHANPHLGWLWQEAADLLKFPEEGIARNPRRGAWFFRWRRQSGTLVTDRMTDEPTITADEWAAFGQWCRNRSRGPAGRAPIPLNLASAQTRYRWTAEPLSHSPLRFEGGPAGLGVDGEGTLLNPPVRLVSGESKTTMASVLHGGQVTLSTRALGPTGSWNLIDGQLASRVGAARGIEVSFEDNGELNVSLADAFAGPPTKEMTSLADRFGVSGTGSGRWELTGTSDDNLTGNLLLHDLRTNQVSVHRRGRHRFALPANNWMAPVKRLLNALNDTPISFSVTTENGSRWLTLTGEVMSRAITLRLRQDL